MSMTPRGFERVSTFSPQQQDIFNQLSQLLSGQLSGEGLEKFQAPYMRQFEEQTVPGLAERFAGLGAGGQSSSAFRQALGGAGAKLSEDLASLGAQQQQGAQSQLMQMLGLSTEALLPKQKPWWQEALTGLAGGAGQALGGLAGGGAAAGAGTLISLLQNLLGGGQQGSLGGRF